MFTRTLWDLQQGVAGKDPSKRSWSFDQGTQSLPTQDRIGINTLNSLPLTLHFQTVPHVGWKNKKQRIKKPGLHKLVLNHIVGVEKAKSLCRGVTRYGPAMCIIKICWITALFPYWKKCFQIWPPYLLKQKLSLACNYFPILMLVLSLIFNHHRMIALPWQSQLQNLALKFSS